MKNVRLKLDKIKELILDSNDFTESGVEAVIKGLNWHKHIIVDSEAEAEELFKEMFADSDERAEEYMKRFGGVHSNCTETFVFDITDPDEYIHQFEVGIYEYYVDSGSVDYIFSVSVSQL